MRILSIGLLLLFTGVFFYGCSGSKSFSRKAAKLEQAGLIDEASDFYYMSLQRNPRNVDAKIGLKSTGSQLLEEKLNAFYKAHSLQADKDAVYTYRDALAYQDKCSPFVKLEIPPYYEEYYQESLNRYIESRYEEATELMYEEKYSEADKIYKEILVLKPDYEDVQTMAKITTVEPIYQKGIQAFEIGRYRSAYKFMDQVLAEKGNYKDAIDYKNDALNRALMTIAVIPFENKINARSTIDEKVYAGVVEKLLQSRSPFVKVIDRNNTAKLIEEQRLNMEAGISGSGAVNAGELLGANVLITGKVLSYSFQGGKAQASRKQGYESYRVKKVNPQTKKTYYETKYRKTYYTEYSGSSKVDCSFQFQMISAETGEILASDLITVTKNDQLNYATYKGNYKNLYAGSFKNMGAFTAGDKVFTSYRDKQALDRKFTTTKRNLKSESALSVDASEDISRKITAVVERYNPEK